MGMFDIMRNFPILVVVFLSLFFPLQAEIGRLLWSKATDWGEIRVRQTGNVRTLMFSDQDGETEESRMLIDAPHRPQLTYLRQMVAATGVVTHRNRSQPYRFLVVGLGGASLSNALAHDYPESTVTSLELEPVVVEAAKRYFFYKESDRVVTAISDARLFLQQNQQEYDAIYLDAFDGVEVPGPLRTIEFAQLLEQRLKPQGAIIANVHFVPERASLRYQKSLGLVFPHSYLTTGFVQGVGIYSRRLLPWSEENQRDPLLKPAPQTNWKEAQPFFDSETK